jgi:hypothetical protein
MNPDLHQPVIFSRLRYHRAECRFIARTSFPVCGPRWEAVFSLKSPCASCLPRLEMAWWLQQITSCHQNCAPHSLLSVPITKPKGRPRAFDPDAYRRVLIHLRDGLSLREVAETMSESENVSCTRQTVWRAVHGYPPYDSQPYRAVAKEVGFTPRTRAGQRVN